MGSADTQAGKPSQAGEGFRLRDGDEAGIEAVRRLVEPVCEAEGLELALIEFRREQGGRVLRLYLDRAGGVSLDDCARVSRQVDAILDVYCGDSDAYTLEVSSAGINRPLWRQGDYERFKGRAIRIKARAPIDGRRNFKGVLLGLSEGMVRLAIDNREFAVPFNGIAKAQLVNDDGVNGW
ncbi:MAG: ribosome maturation factor RimP [Thermodesulfobacteriota bacterium]